MMSKVEIEIMNDILIGFSPKQTDIIQIDFELIIMKLKNLINQ